MSFRLSDFFRYLPYLDTVVEVINDVEAPGSSRERIANALSDLLAGVVPLVAAKNPSIGPELVTVVADLTAYLRKWAAGHGTATVPTSTPPVS